MSIPFRVLIVGDSSTEPSLIERHLCKRWPALVLERVESLGGLQAALKNQGWDCVLCDMSTPGMDALEALSVLKKTTLDVPFLILSDIANFENAITLLKSGADDLIRKDNLERLVPALEEALNDKKGTAWRSKSVGELQQGGHRLGQAQWHALIDTLPDLVWLKDRQGASSVS